MHTAETDCTIAVELIGAGLTVVVLLVVKLMCETRLGVELIGTTLGVELTVTTLGVDLTGTTLGST